jgi:magnesium transporter
MVRYFKTDDRQIHEEESIQTGVWVQMINPSVAEGQMVADALNVDIEDVLAALDEEESSDIP